MEEIWGDIPGYEGRYQVSNLGRVKSLAVLGKTGCSNKDRILKNNVSVYGYARVTLWKNKKPKLFFIHRLVWLAFNGCIPEGMQINHINENKLDNRLENLNLMTPKENTNWGNCIKKRSQKFINGAKSKSVLQYDLDGNFIKEYPSTKEAERQTGIKHISECCLGVYKQMKGYIWKYKEKRPA